MILPGPSNRFTKIVASNCSLPTLFKRRQFLASSSVSNANAPGSSSSDDSNANLGVYRLLNGAQRDLLTEQRALTERCRNIASRVFAHRESDSKSILSQMNTNFLNLDSSFSVVIAGEFNAGKSTLINALLGQKLLESGALPTTDSITIVASSEQREPALPLGVVWHSVSLPLLQDLTVIDTPGTNSTWIDHTERTMRLLPSADLIIFVTSADRPFSDSERTLLKAIQAYRKNIVIVVNKMDILEMEAGDHGKNAKQSVVDFVAERSSELLGARPIVIPISARDALSAKLVGKKDEQQRSNVWHRCNFSMLEAFLKDSLTAQAKLQSKLANPIGVAEGVMQECRKVLEEDSEELQSDIATLSVLQSQFNGWKKELEVDLHSFRQTATELVRNQGERWKVLLHRFNLWSFHYNMLIDRPKLEEEWEDTRLAASLHGPKNLKDELLTQVNEIADAVAIRGRAQGQAVIEYLGKRPAIKNQSLVGSVTAASRFEDTRKNLSERLSSAVNSVIKADVGEKETDEAFGSLWLTAVVSASFQVGALLTAAASFLEFVDPVQGLVGLAALGCSGGASYVWGTSKVVQTYDGRWLDRAKNLDAAFVNICEKETERVSRRILDGVGPYTRFVESEKDRIASIQEECEGLSTVARNLRNRMGKI